jgi:hypothetical protein
VRKLVGKARQNNMIGSEEEASLTHIPNIRTLIFLVGCLKPVRILLNSLGRLPHEADKVTGDSDLKLPCLAQEAYRILGRKPQGFA